MKTENTLKTVTIERVGTLTLSRVIDFAKIAANAEDGKVDASLLTEGGDFMVKLTPTGRDPEPVEWEVSGEAEGLTFMQGFEACADAKKRKTAPAVEFDPAAWLAENKRADVANLKKIPLCALANHLDVEFKTQMKKGEIAALVAKKVPAK